MEKDVKCNLKRAETNFLQTILTTGLESGDTKPFWKYVRSQKQEHFGITALRSNGSLYTDSSSKSENLNKQFKSVFTPPSLVETAKLPGQPFPPIKDLHITEHGVYKLIDGINPPALTVFLANCSIAWLMNSLQYYVLYLNNYCLLVTYL